MLRRQIGVMQSCIFNTRLRSIDNCLLVSANDLKMHRKRACKEIKKSIILHNDYMWCEEVKVLVAVWGTVVDKKRFDASNTQLHSHFNLPTHPRPIFTRAKKSSIEIHWMRFQDSISLRSPRDRVKCLIELNHNVANSLTAAIEDDPIHRAQCAD